MRRRHGRLNRLWNRRDAAFDAWACVYDTALVDPHVVRTTEAALCKAEGNLRDALWEQTQRRAREGHEKALWAVSQGMPAIPVPIGGVQVNPNHSPWPGNKKAYYMEAQSRIERRRVR